LLTVGDLQSDFVYLVAKLQREGVAR
jgi:hypothetical protein